MDGKTSGTNGLLESTRKLLDSLGIMDTLKNHATRIRDLEKGQILVIARLDGLCKRIDDLISIIKIILALLTIWLSASTGFIIWYIQSLT